jgi:ligand-binding sensor domain-containing protein
MTMAEEAQAPSNVTSLEWWRSEAAHPKRCANYLALWLASEPSYRREQVRQGEHSAPHYPAVRYYEPKTDEPMWIEVKFGTHARDYARGYPDNLNDAAKALAAKT